MLDENDIAIIVDTVKAVVDRLLGERLEGVYGVLEETREQMQHTVATLEGNDRALLGELRKIQHATPAEVLTMAGESWERYVRNEAKEMGFHLVRVGENYDVVPSAVVKKRKVDLG